MPKKTRTSSRSKPNERQVRKAIEEFLREEGWKCVKYHGSVFSRAGWPDLFCFKTSPPWRTMLLELKRPGEEPTKLQLAELESIRKAGGLAGVVDSVEQLQTLMRGWMLLP